MVSEWVRELSPAQNWNKVMNCEWLSYDEKFYGTFTLTFMA